MQSESAPADWTWHEKRWRRRRALPIHYGHGWSDSDLEEDPNFALDEKTGLFLPESAAKQRRRVEIGFRSSEPNASI